MPRLVRHTPPSLLPTLDRTLSKEDKLIKEPGRERHTSHYMF